MKKKYLSATVVTAVLLTYFVSAQTAAAFSFRDFFGRGKVKGETTTQNTGNGFFQNMMRRFNQGQNREETGETGNQEAQETPEVTPTPVSPDTVVNRLVSSGKLTAAQGAELLAKLKAIKVKRDELLVLEKDLRDWAKTNKLGNRSFGMGMMGEREGQFRGPSVTPTQSVNN